MRAAERVDLARVADSARRARASSPGQPAKADAEAYGEPNSSGGPSGSTCHHVWPAASSQSTNAVRARRRAGPPGSDVGCSRIPPTAKLHRPDCLPICDAESSMNVRCSPRQPTSARIQIQDVRPQVDCGRYPAKATVGDRVAGLGDDLPRRPRGAARRRALPPAGRDALARAPLEPVGNDRWEGAFAVDELGRWQFTVEAWVDRVRDLARRARPQGRRRAGRARERALRGRGALRRRRARGLARRRAGARRRATAARRRSPKPLEVDVDRERARFGAWYELFPRSWGGFARRRRRCCRSSPSSASTSSTCRPSTRSATTNRKGRNNALVAGAGRPRQPVGDRRRRGRPRRDPPGARHDRRLRAPGRGGREPASRSRSTSPSSARPTTRGCASTPSGSTAGPTGRSSTPRTRPRATRTSTTSTSTRRTGGASGRRSATSCSLVSRAACASSASTTRTRSRSPFWEWLIREVRGEYPETIFLAEAFTRPAMMTTLAKVGFSQSYTYFTWKNTKAELAEFVEQLARWARVLPAELLREHAGHPPRVPAGGRPARLRGAARARSDALADLRHLLRASRPARTCRCAQGSEEYLDSEKYEPKERALDGPLLPLVRRLNEIRRASRRCSTSRT